MAETRDPMEFLRTLPKATGPMSTQIAVRGPNELQQELVRSRLVQSIAEEVGRVGGNPAAFEFGLVIKW
jgi:hypothetical protein